jgi:hypothetical protein
MNVEIGTEAGQFQEKEYINGIFLAVQHARRCLGFAGSELTTLMEHYQLLTKLIATEEVL